MRRVFITVALLLGSLPVSAQEAEMIVSVDVDARDIELSFERGRVRWRFEALDVLQLAVHEPFGGIALDEQTSLAQELVDFRIDLDGERRFFLSFTIDW